MKLLIPISIFIFCLTFPLVAAEAPGDSGKLADEIKQLKLQLADINDHIKQLEASSADSRSFDAMLDGIRLPANPTKDDVRIYIRKVLYVFRNVNIPGLNDSEARKLAAIGKANLDALIGELSAKSDDPANQGGQGRNGFNPGGGTGSSSLFQPLISAIELLADDSTQKTIIGALPEHLELFDVIIIKGWELAAKDTLLKAAKSEPIQSLDLEYIRMMTMYNDKDINEFVKNYVINNTRNGARAYEIAKDMPGIDWKPVIQSAWDKAKGDQRDQIRLVPVALDNGISEAFSPIAEALKQDAADAGGNRGGRQGRGGGGFGGGANGRGGNNGGNFGGDNRYDSFIRKYTDVQKPEDFPTWYETNKNRLVFDPITKKYKIDESKPANVGAVPPPPPPPPAQEKKKDEF